jgi:predicted porin
MSKGHTFQKAAILVAALAALPGAARAELPAGMQLKLYGFLNGEVERVWASGGATPFAARQRVSDGNSRFGGIVTYDIAPHTKAIAQLEGALNFDQGGVSDQASSALLTSRNSFVGVEHAWFGRLVIGNVDSAYRGLVGSGGALGGNLGLTVTGLDLWNNTSAQVSGNFYSPFSRGEARYKNSIHYLSPDWAAVPEWLTVRLAGSYAFDETMVNGRKRDRYSAGLRVAVKGLELGAGFDRQENTGVDVDQLQQGFGMGVDAQPAVATSYLKALAGYRCPAFGTYVGAGVERASYGYQQFVPASVSVPNSFLQKGTMHQTGMMFSFAQPIGPATLMASYARLGALSGAVRGAGADYEGSQYSLGGKWAFNDTFAVYAYYTEIKNHALQTLDLGQAPLFGNELGTPSAFLSPGTSPSAFGVGAIARF